MSANSFGSEDIDDLDFSEAPNEQPLLSLN